ncbi:MAG: hypothetical protein AB1625_13655 [Acidobacteriota bacterium]
MAAGVLGAALGLFLPAVAAAAPPQPEAQGFDWSVASRTDTLSIDLHQMMKFANPLTSGRPAMSGISSQTVSTRLLVAWPNAVGRVRESSGCADLFAKLGHDGPRMLARTRYYGQRHSMARNRCALGASAYTWVGASDTVLCDSFGSLMTPQAMLVLIHEALHFAGLTEYPPYPGAPTSQEINAMVRERCSL